MTGSPKKWTFLALGTAILFAFVIQIPQLLYTHHDARYKGVLVHLNSDEGVYLARVQEALTGRPEQSAEAFVGDPALKGSQPALLERFVGTTFAFTGLDAAAVLQIMDSVGVFLVFLLLFWFFRQSGFRPPTAFAGTVLFCVIELYNLNRPIHQGLSFILLLTALNFLIAGIERSHVLGLLGGIFLGLLFGDYFWTWSFGWLFVALVVIGEFFLRSKTPSQSRRIRFLLLYTLFGAVIALPNAWNLLNILRDPLSEAATFRSGMHASFLPESLAYSVLFALMATGVVLFFWRKKSDAPLYRYSGAFILTAFLVIHQQMVHGITFNFVSHYLFPMAAAAVAVLLLAWDTRSTMLIPAALASVLYLGGLAYDGRHVLTQFSIIDRFEEQHLASVIPELDGMPRSVVLTDPETSMFVAGHTHHDVVYSLYLKNVLMSHEHIARRYCATALPLRAEDRHLERQMLVWPDANGAFKDPIIRDKELLLVRDACTAIDRNPPAALKEFGVRYVLWDEKRQPLWGLQRLRVPLKKLKQGDGWSLWSL